MHPHGEALSVYAIIWMVAEARAVVLNPLLVGNDELVARWGMLARERVPLGLIAWVGECEPAVPRKERLDLAAMGGRAVWIELAEPLEVRGITGKPAHRARAQGEPRRARRVQAGALPARLMANEQNARFRWGGMPGVSLCVSDRD